jgi:hypothetical protein
MSVMDVLREEVSEGQEACSQVIRRRSAAASSWEEAAGAHDVKAAYRRKQHTVQFEQKTRYRMTLATELLNPYF